MIRSRRIQVLMTLGLLLGFLSGCSLLDRFKKTEDVLLGQYVRLPDQEVEDGVQFKWTFADLPDSSQLKGFLPSDSSLVAGFKPDVVGDYVVEFTRIEGEKTKTKSYKYDVTLPEDGTPLEEAPPDFLADYLAAAADSTPAETTSAIAGTTPTGEDRTYLTKLVNPNAAVVEKPKTSKPRATRKKRPRQKARTHMTPREPNRADLIPMAAKTYTIQVSAWPSLDAAQGASVELLEKYGIDNYIQRAFFKDKDEVYYRIRVGNFKSYQDAESYAAGIRERTQLLAWVDFVRQEM